MQNKKTYKLYLILSLPILILAIFSYYLLSPKRYAVFAGYNPNGTIEPYVITYLEGLKEITDGIVYITDSPINEKELQKQTVTMSL